MATITQLENGIVLITLAGELDNHEANQIREEVSTAIFTGKTRAIVWDLYQLGFMDSAGIGLILGRMRDLVPVRRRNTYIESISDNAENIPDFQVLVMSSEYVQSKKQSRKSEGLYMKNEMTLSFLAIEQNEALARMASPVLSHRWIRQWKKFRNLKQLFRKLSLMPLSTVTNAMVKVW